MKRTERIHHSSILRYGSALSILALGVILQSVALAIADRYVTTFPAVTDLVQRHLPFINMFWTGELYFFAFMACFAITFFRERRHDLPYVLVLLGLFYATRSVFLLLLPIGSPADAPLISSRFVFYPYPSHAYFPGGHVGILFLMSRSIERRSIRRVLLVATILFGIGSIVTRAHYTADFFGGLLLAYGVEAWAERHCRMWRASA